MPTRQQYEKATLAGGEVSPALQGATDLRGYQIGLEKQENMVTVLEGVVTRRPGTRFVLELKNQSQRGKLWPFRRTANDYYMLVFNGGAMRVLRGESFVGTGAPYEMAIPWTESQLASLRAAPDGNTLTFVGGGRVRNISRIAADNWSLSEYLTVNGPIEALNADTSKTMMPSALEGNITLFGAGAPFDAGMVAGVIRLDEANASLTTLWSANETVSQPLIGSIPDSAFGDMSNLNYLYDFNNATVATTGNVRSFYAGFHYNSAVAASAGYILANANGFTNFGASNPPELTIEMWGKQGATPSSAIDGVLLGRKVFIDGKNLTVTVYGNDTTTLWNNLWFRVSAQASAPFTIAAAEMIRRAAIPAPILRRWNDNVYEAITDGFAGAGPPVHEEGDSAYGGVTWRFRSKTYGFIRITGITDGFNASGTVLQRLPDSALLTPSYRWWAPAWGDGRGYPDNILRHQQKFIFTRGRRLWATRRVTSNDFLFTPDKDSAIDIGLTPPDGQSLPEIMWLASSGIVVMGAADIEWMLRAPGSNDVLQATTIDPVPDSQEGSVAQIPAKVGRGVIVAGRSGKRLHYFKFNALTQQLEPQEVSAAARHIPMPGIVATAWQKDPHKVLWIVLADGTLAGLTFMEEQKIAAMHRHPMTNGFVEDIAALPALDDGRTDVYLIVRRTINGQTRRYVELLQPFFTAADAAAPTAAGAWYLDCALRYQGSAVTRVTGLTHLIGQSVGVFADGAMQARKVVDGAGGIDLDFPASNVVAGLPIAWRVRDLPRSLQVPGGSPRGKSQRSNHVIIDVLESASGKVRLTYPKDDRNAPDDDTPFEDLIETGADDYGDAIKLFTGQIAMGVTGASGASVVTEIVGDDAMPMTLRAIVPDVIVEGD